MNVKKFIAIATICLAAVFAGTNISAAAESGITIPESFAVEFSSDNVNDYSASGGNFAFACGRFIYVYTYGEGGGASFTGGTLDAYEHTSSVTTVEYSGGELYFADVSATYVYSDGAAAETEFVFTDYGTTVSGGDYTYSINASSYLVITSLNDNVNPTTIVSDATYSALKLIDGTTYVLKENALCLISDGTVNAISLSYNDYETISAIATGDAATALKSSDAITLAAIAADSCLIGIDADSVSNESFTTTGVVFAGGDESAQVLYYPDGGNAAIIAISGKAYLTLKTNITTASFALGSANIASAYLLSGAGVYSLPFESEGTRVATLNAGDVVTVLGTAASSAFKYTYYKVEYSADGGTVTGYVISDLLSPYSFSDDAADSGTITTDISHENDVTTIILIMLIVCLVLIAIGYVTYVATANERKNKKN